MQNLIILSYSDDIAERCYNKWHLFDWTQIQTPNLPVGRDLVNHVVDAIFGLCTIGKALSSQPKAQEVIFINNMKTTHASHIPKSQLVEVCTKSDRCLTLAEFNEVFSSPVDLTLQGEIVWPLDPPLKY